MLVYLFMQTTTLKEDEIDFPEFQVGHQTWHVRIDIIMGCPSSAHIDC